MIGFVGQTQVVELNRVYPDKPEGRARRIDYRHVIHALAAKPQAFRFSRFRDELFPDDNYRQLWQLIDQQWSSRDACKWMVTVLRIAADHQCEVELGQTLLKQAQTQSQPDLKTLQSRYLTTKEQPEINSKQHDITDYDALLSGQWMSLQPAGDQPCHSR